MEEKQLILNVCQNDDEQSFRTLLKRYEPFIYKNISMLSLDYGDYCIDKDDLYQEACLALYSACKTYRFDMKCQFSSFAYLVIRRKLLSYYRKVSTPIRQETKSLDKVSDLYYSKLMGHASRERYAIEKEALARDINYIHEFIGTLSPIEKEIVNKRYDSVSYSDIAKSLNLSIKSIYHRVGNIRKKFKAFKKLAIIEDDLNEAMIV